LSVLGFVFRRCIEIAGPFAESCVDLGAKRAGLDDVRVVVRDAVEVIEHMLDDRCVDAINLFFPDPWPKKRHHKRRLVQAHRRRYDSSWRGSEGGTLMGRISSRRAFHGLVLSLAAGAMLAAYTEGSEAQTQTDEPLRIGLIGSGRMGGAVGLRLAEAGHEIFFSSRNPDELTELVEQAGGNARAGTPQEAAEFGEVVMIAVPYGVLPEVGNEYGDLLRGKVVIDLGNPREDRDGPMAREALRMGTGVASAEYLPGVRLVRTFNAISFVMVREQAHRDGELIGVPIAGDDREAVAIAEQLVRDAGFEPVVVGPLSSAQRFDAGTDVYVRGMTAQELRDALDLE
jgi:8-hydroxy-5-deazaflavin:NADPH oxidoreductase